MGKQKITGLSTSLFKQSVSDEKQTDGVGSIPAKPVVQTVKVPQDLYVRLKIVGARERRSSQDIILTAVREYLTQFQVSP